MVPEAISQPTGSDIRGGILLPCPGLETFHQSPVSSLSDNMDHFYTCALELAARATSCWTRAVLGLVSRCTSAISAATFALPPGPVG